MATQAISEVDGSNWTISKSMKMQWFLGLAGAVGYLQCNAQVLFSDDFDADTSNDWIVLDESLNEIPDATVIFAHDYSQDKFNVTRAGTTETMSVPMNPFASGETTLGLKLAVNSDAEASEASVSVFPREAEFTGDYALRFEMFMSYNGPAYGGSGSTEFATMGVGHSGELVAFLDGNEAVDGDGSFFAVSGEGGASRDFRAYVGDGFSKPSFLDEANDRFGFTDMDGDGIGEYNTFVGGPMERVFPFAPHETEGAPGKGWVRAEVWKLGDEVTWVLNGQIITTLSSDHALADGNKVMIGYSDPFSSIANPGAENFVIFDNLRVERLAAPTTPPVVSVTVPGEVARDEESGLDVFQATPVDEGSGAAEFHFTRSGETDQALTVPFRLEGSALASEDYEALTAHEVSFAAGETETTLAIPLIDDREEELPETIELIIEPSTAYRTASGKYATLPLIDNGDAGTPEPDILAGATVVFSEAFESDVADAWQVNRSSDDSTVTFGYDYSVDGIPPAPETEGDSTLGLKFTANESVGAADHITASPIGQSFSEDYALTFDLWLNFNGPIPGGGGGSTEFAAAGIGTSGDHIQTADDASDGAWFLLTGDGGSSRDYRFFLNNFFLTEDSGAYVAGSQDNGSDYYASIFPSGKSAPELQTTDFPQQTGTTVGGQPAFEWVSVQLVKQGGTVTWLLKGSEIVVASQSLGSFNDSGNIFLGYSDWFSSVSDNVDLSFVLFDNVKVYQLPELNIERTESGVVVRFGGTLESSTSITGPWEPVDGATSPHSVELGAGDGAMFFRVAP